MTMLWIIGVLFTIGMCWDEVRHEGAPIIVLFTITTLIAWPYILGITIRELIDD